MQHSPGEIKEKLLNALDQDNNVVNMAAVMEVICVLETTHITKDILETTRLGKYINELRKKTDNKNLAKRAKALVRKWRTLIDHSVNGSGQGCPGAVLTSPAINSRRLSPNTFPVSGAITSLISPSGSLPSSASTSPILSRPETPLAINRSKTISPGPGRPLLPYERKKSDLSFPPISPTVSFKSSSPRIEMGATKRPIPICDQTLNKIYPTSKRFRRQEEIELDLSVIPLEKESNYNNVPNGFEDCRSLPSFDECSRESFLSEKSDKVPGSVNVIGEKSVFRKNRKNSKLKAGQPDLLREQFASLAGRASKVKTTQEIIADLAQSSGSQSLVAKAEELAQNNKSENTDLNDKKQSSLVSSKKKYEAEMSKNKCELMEKYLESQRGSVLLFKDENSSMSSEKEDSPSPIKSDVQNLEFGTKDLTVEEILARLPPIDPSILLNDDDNHENIDSKPITMADEDINKLHTDDVDGLNGNVDCDGNFKPWQEVVLQKSYKGDILPILPYVIID